ncbi:hypothetical protein HY214_03850 [Candidatus Roizmanbacteria bacterium]|nr:hypothetical protein [Candidatus Roizmanbacteria bacterium]
MAGLRLPEAVQKGTESFLYGLPYLVPALIFGETSLVRHDLILNAPASAVAAVGLIGLTAVNFPRQLKRLREHHGVGPSINNTLALHFMPDNPRLALALSLLVTNLTDTTGYAGLLYSFLAHSDGGLSFILLKKITEETITWTLNSKRYLETVDRVKQRFGQELIEAKNLAHSLRRRTI